jgi:hypothetical protein
MNTSKRLLPLCLFPARAPLAQPAASTVVFLQTLRRIRLHRIALRRHAGESCENQLTFRSADHLFALVSGSGVSYRQNGVWAPAHLQVAAFNDGSRPTYRPDVFVVSRSARYFSRA